MSAAWKICALVALCCALFSSVAVADVALSADCQDRLNVLWSNYTNPVYIFPDCDADCLSDCKETLEMAIYTTEIKACPLQDDITRCFKYYAPEWESYVEECSLFTVDDSGLPAGSTGEAEGESSSSSTSTDVEAESEAGRRRTLLAEGEAESEAAASSGSGICFPSFKSTDEFNLYINGQYFTLAYDPPSDTAGIVMSVFFWVGLVGMGFYLRKS